MYLFNTDEHTPEHYTTLSFSLTSRWFGAMSLDISSYIDEQTIWRLTDSSARDMLRNIIIKGKDFDVDYQIQAINGKWIGYHNYITLVFTEKNPVHEKPVTLVFKYNVKLLFKVTDDLIRGRFKELTESILSAIAQNSKVELVSTDFCVSD